MHQVTGGECLAARPAAAEKKGRGGARETARERAGAGPCGPAKTC